MACRNLQELPALSEAFLMAPSSASVSVANLLIATTTGIPYCLVFSMCLTRLHTPFSTRSTFSSLYSDASGVPAETGGPPPCIFNARTAQGRKLFMQCWVASMLLEKSLLGYWNKLPDLGAKDWGVSVIAIGNIQGRRDEHSLLAPDILNWQV